MNGGWRCFLHGLLANHQEQTFSAMDDPRLCPVVFALCGGWLVVMRRARAMTDAEFEAFDFDGWIGAGGTLPLERKASSFGWLGGVTVAVDYG